MPMAYDIRPVEPSDLDLICRHRHLMFQSTGRDEAVLAPMTEAFRPWLAPRLQTGEYFGWIAERDGVPVGGLGMMVIDWPPHPAHPTQAARGYILNLYVEPEHRGHGIAGTLMGLAQAEARRRGIEYLILHATQAARGMYEKLGWRQTSEMSIAT